MAIELLKDVVARWETDDYDYENDFDHECSEYCDHDCECDICNWCDCCNERFINCSCDHNPGGYCDVD